MKRVLILLILLTSLPSVATEVWRLALGDLSQLSPAERAWYENISDFQLRRRARPGETVAEFFRRRHNRPGPERRVIVIRWLGEPMPALDLKALERYVEAFMQLPVRVERGDYRLPPEREGKVSAEDIQRDLRRSLPDDAFAIIGLTNVDIYSEDGGPDRLLFGQGHYYNRTAVASLYELRTERTNLLHHRAFKLVTHELVHTLAVEHCGEFYCFMNSSGSVRASDERPLFACPICLRKMQSVLGFEVGTRYQDLSRSLAPALSADREWLQRRMSSLE